MKRIVKMWKCKLEDEIKEYTSCKMTPESLDVTEKLGRNWMLYDDIWVRLNSYEDTPYVDEAPIDEKDTSRTSTYRLTDSDIYAWNAAMKNADGTNGGHWTEDQTTSLAQTMGVYFQHITPLEWNVTCNMMYSDYYMVAQTMGVDTPEFYGGLSKAFLFDRDGPGPSKKLCAYYHDIVVSYS